MTPTFKLGDTVCSKRLGQPQVGVVAGILVGTAMIALLNNETMWFATYPNWLTKPVYLVELREACRPGARSVVESDDTFLYLYYPEDDLEEL